MLMTGLFLNLQKKGIDPGDIRQLLYMNVPSEKIDGLIRCLDYWCREWKGKRFPTPLNIVYCLDHLKMIALPFLDTAISQDKIWGIALGNLIIHKKAIQKVARMEVDDLLHECSYYTYQSSPGVGNREYGIRVPTIHEVHQITTCYRDIQGTIGYLREYRVDFDNWDCSDYWVQSLEPPYPMSVSVIEDYRTFVRLPATDDRKCVVRPVLSLFEEAKDEGLDFVGKLDEYGIPDKMSERFAKKLRK